MDIQDYLEALYKVIHEGHLHPYYKKKEDIRKWILSIKTGEYQSDMIVRWRQKETKEQKEQRVRVYNSRTPQIFNKVKSYFYEVHRTEDFVEVLEYSGDSHDSDGDKKTKLIESSKYFYGQKTVREYLHARQIEKNFTDPNEWLVVEWNNEGVDKDVPFYPYEVKSANVLDFKVDYGTLQYLIIRKSVKIKQGDEEKDGWKYTLYGKEYSVEAFKIDDTFTYVDDISRSSRYVGKEGKFDYITYENKLDEVQAAPFGYLPHPECEDWVFVSPLHVAKSNIDRLIQRTSTLDISIACHGFLQKFIYANPCNYHKTDDDLGYIECDGGMFNGDKCPKCKGSGMQVHASDQDVVYLPLPDGDAQVIPLSNLVYYANIDKELVVIQREEVRDAMRDCLSTIFNENVFEKSEVVTTATENMLNWRSVNNTLSPYADHDAQMYEFIIRVIAKVLQIFKNLTHNFTYPSDYHLESLQEIIMIRGQAAENGIPDEMLMNIDVQILRKQIKDDSQKVLNWQALQNFKPFRGLPDSQIIMVTNAIPQDHPALILYYNFNTVSDEITEKYPEFYSLGYDGQRKIIYAKVDEIKSRPDAIIPVSNNIINAG